MIIRQEKESDFREIYELIKKAFETSKVKEGDEQDFVNDLRKSDKYIPELALVAEDEGRLIAHIMLTRMEILGKGKAYEELLLAPVCVALEYRNRGIGGKLINKSFELAERMGYSAVFLRGDPAYYSRLGFKPTILFGIRNKGDDVPVENAMVCEIIPGGLQNKTGIIDIP